jgi:putative ABC transport system substrate-binding protein
LASIPVAVAALQKRTRTIPIVFTLVADPVEQGFVYSIAQPGGNITGFTSFEGPLMAKWLQLLKEIAPAVTRVAIIFNPETAPHAKLFNPAIEAAAPSFGITVMPAPVRDDAAIEQSIAAVANEPGGGLISLPDSFTATHRVAIITAATRHHVPLIGASEFFPKGGALMSYFIDVADTHAQAASYIDRILRGASPADLPVQEPTKYSLIINLKTAKVLGLTVPPSLLARADEVIE